MKVNILTQPLFCNYGGILQNYALQQVLIKMGHEPLTVNVPTRMPSKSIVWKETLKTIRNLMRRLQGAYQYPFLNPHTFSVKEHELSFPQREFVAKYIRKADERAPFTADTCERYPADVWIVGSDQVWRPWCSPYITNCFFDFVPDNVRKIAYAASFGTDNWEIDSTTTIKISELGKRFHEISVREESGVCLSRDVLGLAATHVLDPTMLLSAEDYLRIISDEPQGKESYIATYVLDLNKEKNKAIKRLSLKYNLPLRKVGRMHRDRFDSVESWISGIARAERVITDSFHGTVFSLIFGRPVKIMGNELRGNTRINSLLSLLKPEPDADGFYTMTSESRSRLADWQKTSLEFLSRALSSD